MPLQQTCVATPTLCYAPTPVAATLGGRQAAVAQPKRGSGSSDTSISPAHRDRYACRLDSVPPQKLHTGSPANPAARPNPARLYRLLLRRQLCKLLLQKGELLLVVGEAPSVLIVLLLHHQTCACRG